jgi:hypothetical protein
MEAKNGLDDGRILIAGAISAISTLVAEIVSWALKYIGFGKNSLYQINSLIITGNRPSFLLGLILNVIIGAILGAIVYLILKKWGHRYTLTFSIMCALIMWFIWEIVFTINIEGTVIPRRPISGYYDHLICTVVYGASMGFMLKRFIFSKM